MQVKRSPGERSTPAGGRPQRSQPDTAAVPAIPTIATSFLGRDEEQRKLADLLQTSRLVTLTGAPGIGKSRLAVELARQQAARYRHGARLAELAPITDPALVPGALASALSVTETPPQDLTDTLVAALRRRSLLLVLDNCEHVLGACAQVVELLLAGCSELSVITTSREALRLPGETVYQLPPLSVPDPDEVSPDRLLGYDAVRLFVERATAAQPAFGFSPYVAESIAEISRRLDGMPLAIELAAARTTTFTPMEIAARLEDRFGLLRAGARSDLSPHRTLEASLDWSHDLLSEAEAALLRRLSVFRGGFSPQAVQAVCGGKGLKPHTLPDLLEGLVGRSLVVTAPEQAHYRLLETIRAYAGERLDQAGETADMREAHARFYLSLAEEAEPALSGPDQVGWLERLEAERENLRAALEWSLGSGHGEVGVRLAGALVLFWRVRCHFSDGRDLLEAVLPASAAERPELRAKVLWGAGFLALMSGSADVAASRLEESLALARELGDAQGVARALLVLGNSRQHRGDPRALSLLEESAAMAERAGDAWCLAHALGLAANEHVWLGELPVARPLLEECLAVARRAEDAQSLRLGLLGLGLVTLLQGEYDFAESLVREALDLLTQLGEDFGSALALQYLAELALLRGEYERAQELVERALALNPDVGPPEARLRPQLLQGRVAHALGDPGQARELLEDALSEIGTRGGFADRALLWMGELAEGDGDSAAAQHLFEQALELGRARGSKIGIANALHALGRVVAGQGDLRRAGALQNEALELRHQIGDAPGVVGSLEAVAGLAAASGSHHQAATLMGAADAVRRQKGYTRAPWERAWSESALEHVRGALPPVDLDAARAAGARLTIDEAVLEASQGRSVRGRPSSGWSSLTESERKVAALVAEGLSNPEIAERLVIARETVKSHLSNIFAKLGVTNRREIEREPGAGLG